MPTAQDIYNSLRENPDYLSLDDGDVEREAIRRARQHANNEKALSMAVQNSAMGKLLSFIEKLFVQKELKDFDRRLLEPEKQAAITKFLVELRENLAGYLGNEGWGENPPAPGTIGDEEMIVYDNKPHSIYAVGANYATILQVLDWVQRGLTGSTPVGMADIFAQAPQLGRVAEQLFRDNGTINENTLALWEKFKDHPSVKRYNEGVADARGEVAATPTVPISDEESGDEDAEPNPYDQYKSLTRADKDRFDELRWKHFPGIGVVSSIPEVEMERLLELIETRRKMTGNTTDYPGREKKSERDAELKARRQKLFDDFKPRTEESQGMTPDTGDDEEETPEEETSDVPEEEEEETSDVSDYDKIKDKVAQVEGGHVEDDEQAEFLDNLSKLSDTPIDDILGEDTAKVTNLVTRAVYMLNKTEEEKLNILSRWHRIDNDTSQRGVEGPSVEKDTLDKWAEDNDLTSEEKDDFVKHFIWSTMNEPNRQRTDDDILAMINSKTPADLGNMLVNFKDGLNFLPDRGAAEEHWNQYFDTQLEDEEDVERGTGEVGSETPEEGGEDKGTTLHELNEKHIEFAPINLPSYTVKSPFDYEQADGTMRLGWDSFSLSKSGREFLKNKKIIDNEDLGLGPPVDRNWTPQWNEQVRAKFDYAEVLKNIHKLNLPGASPITHLVRTDMLKYLFGLSEEGTFPTPTELGNQFMREQHSIWTDERRWQEENPTRRSSTSTPPGPHIINALSLQNPEDVATFKEFYSPREINGPEAKPLKPKDINGNEFDPIEDIDDWKENAPTKVQEQLDKLKEIFTEISKDIYGGEKFPLQTVDPATGEARMLRSRGGVSPKPDSRIFLDKANFSDEQKLHYNELNTDRAIVEGWLKALGHVAYKGDKTSWMKDIWGGEYPADEGAWTWYQTMEGLKSYPERLVSERERKGLLEEGEEEKGMQGFVMAHMEDETPSHDEKGNANFMAIPESAVGNKGYNAGSWSNVRNFRNSFGVMGKSEDEDNLTFNRVLPDSDDMTRGQVQEVLGKEWVGKHFNEAWHEWRETYPPNDKNEVTRNWAWEPGQEHLTRNTMSHHKPGIFLDWLGADEPESDDLENKPRWQAYAEKEDGQAPPGDEIPPGSQAGSTGTEGTGTEGTGTEGAGADLPPRGRRPTAGGEEVPPKFGKDGFIWKKVRDYLMATHDMDSDEVAEYMGVMGDKEFEKYWQKHLDARQDAAKEKPEPKKSSEFGTGKRNKLVEEYSNAYRELHNQAIDSRTEERLKDVALTSDKELSTLHRGILDDTAKNQRAEAQQMKRGKADNITYDMPPLHQEHLTKDDILMRARKLIHHQQAYGQLMGNKAKETWHERMEEAHQLAAAANMDLPLRLQEDFDEAQEKGDYGSTAWLERIGGAHEETLKRRDAHRNAVNGASELRTNANYKPWLVADYNTDGSFMAFRDLRTNQPVDQHELTFDDQNHYYFHGLDPEKVRKYRQYQQLKNDRGEQPYDIPNPFSGRTEALLPDDQSKLKELEDEMKGPEYKAIAERLETHGKLESANQLFDRKFVHAGDRRPKKSDGTPEAPPLFYKQGNRDARLGWYHPESESWINPHRYQELIDSMEGRQGAGRVVNQGLSYVGKGNPTNNAYAFAVPTEANKQKLKHQDQVYYVDHTGSIAHANDNFEGNHLTDHDQPQPVNGVIHDWYAQQIGNQIKANRGAFIDEQNNPRQVAVVDAPPGPSIQAMWFELEALGREEGSALARREKKKASGWNWTDSKVQPLKTAVSRVKHPLSGIARDPLSRQELGQYQEWSKWKEFKQRAFDVIEYPQAQIFSWALKAIVGGEKPEDKVIRRIRQGYKEQAETEKLLRESANRMVINGTKLSDQYVAPGEQQARDEDYLEIRQHLSHNLKYHQNQGRAAQQAGNKQNVAHHKNEHVKYQDASNKLAQLNAKMPHHWKGINDIHQTYLSRVNQAPAAEDSMAQWGLRMAQPYNPHIDNRHPLQEIPNVYSGRSEGDIPNVYGSSSGAEIPNVYSGRS